jgi:hypothetical protein
MERTPLITGVSMKPITLSRLIPRVLRNKDAMSCPYELTTYKYVIRGNGQARA